MMNDGVLIPLSQMGERIILNTPTARCLELLIERQGLVVSRDDFLEEVWGTKGIVVSHNTFYQNISLLRKSLKKTGLSDNIVVTVRRKGFTLSSDVVITYEHVDYMPPELLGPVTDTHNFNPLITAPIVSNKGEKSVFIQGPVSWRNISCRLKFLILFILLAEMLIFLFCITD